MGRCLAGKCLLVNNTRHSLYVWGYLLYTPKLACVLSHCHTILTNVTAAYPLQVTVFKKLSAN